MIEDSADKIEYCPAPETIDEWGSLRVQTHSSVSAQTILPLSEDSLYSKMISIKHIQEEEDIIISQWNLVQKTKDSLLNAEAMLACIKQIKLFSGTGCVLFHTDSGVSEQELFWPSATSSIKRIN